MELHDPTKQQVEVVKLIYLRSLSQICLQTIGLHGHFVENELPSQPDDVVVCALLRLNPGKQLTLRIEHDAVAIQTSVLLGRQGLSASEHQDHAEPRHEWTQLHSQLLPAAPGLVKGFISARS